MNTPEERLCSRSWRLRHSSWILWPILTFGLANAVGFWIVAARTRRRTWILFAAGWTVIDVLVWVFSSIVDTGTKADPSQSTASTLFGLFIMANWIGGIVHAFLLRRSWLRWRAHHQSGAWYAESSDGSRGGPPQSAQLSRQQAEAVLRGPAAGHPGVHPVAPAQQFGGTRESSPQTAAWQPPKPVDVNEAGIDAFRGLGLTLEDAQRIVATRERLGSFRTKDQLMTAAGLPPHVFMNLQNLLILGPSTPSGAPGFAPETGRDGDRGAAAGRRLDL